MNNLAQAALFAGVVLFSGGAGFVLYHLLNHPAEVVSISHADERATSESDQMVRPPFLIKDLSGQLRSVSEWDGQVLIINFWATWCPPCLREIPHFISLQEELAPKGVQFVGIAIDELDSVKEFATRQGINYPILVGDDEGEGVEIAKRYGNRLGALPYSVVIARDGRITARHAGELSESQLRELIKGLL